MKNNKDTIDQFMVSDIYEKYSFNQTKYKAKLLSLKSKNENPGYFLKAKYENAIALNAYIEKNVDRSKMKLINKTINKLSAIYVPLITFFLVLSGLFIFLIILTTINNTINDPLVISSLVIVAALTIVEVTLLVFYAKKYLKLSDSKNEYFSKALMQNVKIDNLKKEISQKVSQYSYIGSGPVFSSVAEIKFPDIAKNSQLVADKFSKLFTFYGMKVKIQDAQLFNNLIDTKEAEKNLAANKEETNQKEPAKKETVEQAKIQRVKLFEIDLKNSDFMSNYIPFHLFKDYKFLKSSLTKTIDNGKDFNDLFNLKGVEGVDYSPLVKKLKDWESNLNFNSNYLVNLSSLEYYNFILKGILMLNLNNEDDFNQKLPIHEFENPFKNLAFPEYIDDDTEVSLWFIVANFEKMVNYLANSKILLEKYFNGICYYVLDELNQVKKFGNKKFEEISAFN